MRLRSLQHARSELQRWPCFHQTARFGSDGGEIGLTDNSALQNHRVQHELSLAADVSRTCSDRAGNLGEALVVVASVVAINATCSNSLRAAEPGALRHSTRKSYRDQGQMRTWSPIRNWAGGAAPRNLTLVFNAAHALRNTTPSTSRPPHALDGGACHSANIPRVRRQ